MIRRSQHQALAKYLPNIQRQLGEIATKQLHDARSARGNHRYKRDQ
jgi:hypothetical protein